MRRALYDYPPVREPRFDAGLALVAQTFERCREQSDLLPVTHYG
jgi:hypothetical protein